MRLLRHEAVGPGVRLRLGSAAQLDVLDIVEADGDVSEFEQLERGEHFVENAGAATIAVCIVISDAHQVATFEALELPKARGLFLP